MAELLPSFDALRALADRRGPRVALVLGSGLGGLVEPLTDAAALDFGRVPGLGATSVAGHRGQLLLGTWARQSVLVFAGRRHYYEGHSWETVVQPVHLARQLGATILLTTNAVGGIRPDLVPGTLVTLVDQLEATGPLWGGIAPRPPSPFDADLRTRLQQAAAPLGIALAEGTYAQVTGPSYETPAEIRALRALGADAVGMSTAREARTAYDLGLRVAAVACVTNRAAGLGDGPIHHGEVLLVADRLRDALTRLLETFLSRLEG